MCEEEDCRNYDIALERFTSEFSTAVREKDIGKLLMLKYFVEDLEDHPQLKESLVALNLLASENDVIEMLRTNFVMELCADQFIDVYSEVEIRWFAAKILDVDHDNNTLRVHYVGWPSKYDENFFVSSKRICPINTFTPAKRKTPKPDVTKGPTTESVEMKPTHEMPENSLNERGSRRRSRSAVAFPADPGAVVKRRNTNGNGSTDPATAGEGKEDEKGEKEEKDHNDWVCTICGWFEAPDGSDLVCCDAFCKRSFHLGCMQVQGRMTAPIGEARWFCDDCVLGQHLCFVCGQRGVDCQDVHKCVFPHCGKYYHQACLEKEAEAGRVLPTQFNIVKKKAVSKVIAVPRSTAAAMDTVAAATDTPKKTDKKCKAEPGATETATVTPRASRGSRKDYKSLNTDGTSPSTAAAAALSPASATESFSSANLSAAFAPPYNLNVPANCTFSIQKVNMENVVSFKCPRHACFNCFEFHGILDGADLNGCLACPRSFHTNCILPGSRFNSMCVLCPLHPDAPLPSHDVRLNPKVAGAKKLAPSNEYSAFWDMLAIPEENPDPADPFANHFKLQTHVKDAAEDVPQTFTKITRNDYDTFPEGKLVQGFVPEVACECTVDCGDDCLNRILRIECCDTKIKAAAGEGRGSGDRCICAIGSGCANRALQSRKYAKTEPFREFQMGWGLRAKEDIEAFSLVMEYVGEVIDNAEVHRRMEAQRVNTPQDKDFYIMELDNGMFVDGKFKGSTSRYINHSCDPNCELQRWVVKGYPRIGIFALRDICAGEPLSYDYQFDTNEAEAFKCYCGADKCRGTMAPKKKKKGRAGVCDAQGRPQSKEERDRLILMGKVRQQTMGYEGMIEAEWSRSYTGRFIPGDPINEMRNGPVKATLGPAQDARLLLVRNVRRGANLFERRERLQHTNARRLLVRGPGGGKTDPAPASAQGLR